MPGTTFDAELDEALARGARERDAAAPAAAGSVWAWRSEPPVGPAFLFARPLTSATPRWTGEAKPRRRPAHTFTDVQRLAFERLVLLGADLADDFSAEDLRREYRRLARRFHPDAHAHCAPLERAQLARSFVEAAEDYRCLREVVETRH